MCLREPRLTRTEEPEEPKDASATLKHNTSLVVQSSRKDSYGDFDTVTDESDVESARESGCSCHVSGTGLPSNQ